MHRHAKTRKHNAAGDDIVQVAALRTRYLKSYQRGVVFLHFQPKENHSRHHEDELQHGRQVFQNAWDAIN